MLLLPEIRHQLLALVTALASNDNQVRSDAERLLAADFSERGAAEMLLVFLAEEALAGPAELRAYCAVLFRRFGIKPPKDARDVGERLLARLLAPAAAHVRLTLLAGFAAQQDANTRHKLADAIAEMAKEGTWDELLPAVFSLPNELAYRIAAAAPEILAAHILQASPFFAAGFADATAVVRTAAATAFVAFFVNTPKDKWPALAPLLGPLLQLLPALVGDSEALASVLESLIELVELAPKMFRPMFADVVAFCASVCGNRECDTARSGALELLTTFAETLPKMCLAEPTFLSTTIQQALAMMTEVLPDDDEALDFLTADDKDEEDDEPEYFAARQALDRIALRLQDALAPPLFQYLPQMALSADWRARHALLMALSSVAEGCVNVLIGELSTLLDMVVPAVGDAHPRVQYAACNALGQMSTDFADTLQRTCGERVVPVLITAMTSAQPRVQAHAAAALVNFAEAAPAEVLAPHLDGLVQQLIALLGSPQPYVQEQALTTLAVVADLAAATFTTYYTLLMPLLVGQLEAGVADRQILARCIECALLIALAVGPEVFGPDAERLTNAMLALQGDDSDDPVQRYLESAWGRICRVVGAAFTALLPRILPRVMENAQATQDISLLEDDQVEEFEQDELWDVMQHKGRHIAVHTAVLDDKQLALESLHTFAEVLGAGFAPYVEESANAALGGLGFYLHDGVRSAAASCLPALLKVVASNQAATAALYAKCASGLAQALEHEPVTELLGVYYAAFAACVQVVGEVGSEPLGALATAVLANMADLQESISNKGEDDEWGEDIPDEDLGEEDVLDELNRCIAAVFKADGAKALPLFEHIAAAVLGFLQDPNGVVQLAGLCIVSDMVEHTGEALARYQEVFVNAVGQGLSSPDPAIRQASAFTVGNAAAKGGEAYRAFVAACVAPLGAMLGDTRTEENASAIDNALAAVAKMARGGVATELLPQWFAALPATADAEAAQYVYGFLAELVDGRRAEVGDVHRLVVVVAAALGAGVLTPRSIQRVVGAMKAVVGGDVVDEYVRSRGPGAEQLHKWWNQ